MKQIILFLLWSCVAFAQGVKPAGAWLPVHVKWEHAPTTINPKLEMGATTVLYFDDQKRSVVVGCVVNRESGRYTISNGDGHVVSVGEWDGQLPGEVKYRLVSRTVEHKGETLPGPWHEQKLASTPKGYLLFEGKLYRPVQDLATSVRERYMALRKRPGNSFRALLILALCAASGTADKSTATKADRALVVKRTRTLTLFNQREVLKTYQVALGGDPNHHAHWASWTF